MRSSLRGRWPLVCAAGLAFGVAHADEPDALSPHVVVTATRVATPIDEVLAPTLVIDRQDIDRSPADDAAELLRNHAGLEVARNGGPGQAAALFVRGAESNHTLVLVDGVRINPGTIGLAALQNIPTQSIDHIEVVKGPRSALYGSDAIGGVVNVVTRRGAKEGWVTEVGYGAYATREASISGGFAGQRNELDLGLAWTESDGFPTRTTDDENRGFRNLSATAQWRTRIGATELALRHWGARGHTEYTDFLFAPVDQDFRTSSTSAEVRRVLGEQLQARLGLGYFDDHTEQNQSADFLRTQRTTVDTQFDWAASDRHDAGAGVMYSSERASSESFGDAMRATTDVWNLYLQDRYTNGSHRALAAIGLTEHETAGGAVTWNLEYGYESRMGALFYGLAGTGFRAPDATDRFGYGGNADLRPERSRNFEIGLRQSIAGKHGISLSAFRTDIEDLIEFVTLSFDPFYGENRNVGRARIQGIEAAYEFTARSWRVRMEAIYQDPENRDTGEQLLRRARENLTLWALKNLGPLEIGINVLAAGERKDFGFPEPVTMDSYVLTSLSARWQISPALQAMIRLDNAFDEQYELAHGFNTPGRGLYVSLRYAPGHGHGATVAETAATDSAGYTANTGGRHPQQGQSWATD